MHVYGLEKIVRKKSKASIIYNPVSAILLLVLTSSVALAAPREGGSSADANIKRLLQELTSERDALQAKNTDLTEKLEAGAKQQDKISAKLARRDNSLVSFKASNRKFADRLKTCTEDRLELIATMKGKVFEIENLNRQNLNLDKQVEQLNSQLARHVDNNRRLVEISNELLGHYEGKGVVAVIKHREPLTQVSRVSLENLVQEYKFEIQDLSFVDKP